MRPSSDGHYTHVGIHKRTTIWGEIVVHRAKKKRNGKAEEEVDGGLLVIRFKKNKREVGAGHFVLFSRFIIGGEFHKQFIFFFLGTGLPHFVLRKTSLLPSLYGE